LVEFSQTRLGEAPGERIKHMFSYALRRILQAVPSLLGVALVTFLLVRVSGDPAAFVLGELASPEDLARFRAEHGLDRPLFVQFGQFLAGSLRGDFGTSLRFGQPVLHLFLERLPATVELGLSAYLVSMLVGVSLGVYAGARTGSRTDKAVRVLVLFGQAVPNFYLGLLMIIVFAAGLGILPTGGRGGWANLVLPTITLSSGQIALIARFTRSAIQDVLRQDYVRTARSKGLSELVVLRKHVLKNAMIPLLTLLALQSSVIFTGAAVTETVFSWPGVGRMAVRAITARDYPVVQGTVLILTALVVVVNVLVDISYGLFDPRVKYS
jgi:peptide/nickel transport system permease protein